MLRVHDARHPIERTVCARCDIPTRLLSPLSVRKEKKKENEPNEILFARRKKNNFVFRAIRSCERVRIYARGAPVMRDCRVVLSINARRGYKTQKNRGKYGAAKTNIMRRPYEIRFFFFFLLVSF